MGIKQTQLFCIKILDRKINNLIYYSSKSTRKQVLVVLQYADVAELADALDLGSSVYDVQVQLLSSAVFFCLTKKIKIK